MPTRTNGARIPEDFRSVHPRAGKVAACAGLSSAKETSMRALILFPILLLAACAGTDTSRVDRGRASISGKIAYPSEVTPSMRICAVRDGAPPTCTASPAGSKRYRLEHLPAGDYQIVAKLSEGDMRVGGHVQPVQCIRAPCPEQLKTVTVAAGAELDDIDLNGFYAARDDFPTLP
jgi:hypothetical protein